VLVALGKIKEKFYPYIIFGISIIMVLTTTLAGPNLVGSDIHLDYYYAQLRNGRDVLPPLVGQPQGTSILAYLTDWIWAYKIIYPLMFCIVPILMYYIFRRWTDSTKSFMGSFFFIAFPVFFLELPTIPKQMVAQLFFMGGLTLILLNRQEKKLNLLLIIIIGLVPLLHYSIGILGSIILGMGLLTAIILKHKVRKPLLMGFLSIIIVSSIYFPIAEDGAVYKKLGFLYNSFVPPPIQISFPPVEQPTDQVPDITMPGEKVPFLDRYETLLKSGLGLDFLEVSFLGKVFRILQWGLLCLLCVGLWKLRKIKEFLIMSSGFVAIVVLLVVPGWAGIMNSSRFIHVALLMLALPVAIPLKPKFLLLFLIPYFLFTSGFIFEVTKQPAVDTYDIPYSIGLSNYRMDMGVTYTEGDFEVRDYIVDNNLFPVNSDMWGSYFILEKVGQRPDINLGLQNNTEGYVFIRGRNIQDGTFTIWNGVGLRKFVKPEVYGINWDENIIFKSGDSRVIWVE